MNIKQTTRLVSLLFILSIFSTSSIASQKYILCGPDEDGCYQGIYSHCNCIPYNEQQGNQAYCLDFDTMRCYPLTQKPDCDTALISKDQASCLSTIFQSEPEPGCLFTTDDFCLEQHMNFCDEDGHPGSCHKESGV